jgi:hypothetical protein
MANRHRGEIDATFDGMPHKLCLTLGALAELEAAFGDADMLALAQRFESGRLKASDAVRIIGAGLRGGGHQIADEDVAVLKADGGAAGFVAVVAQLLAATFGADGNVVRAEAKQSRSGLPQRPTQQDCHPGIHCRDPGCHNAGAGNRRAMGPGDKPRDDTCGVDGALTNPPLEVGRGAPFPGTK